MVKISAESQFIKNNSYLPFLFKQVFVTFIDLHINTEMSFDRYKNILLKCFNIRNLNIYDLLLLTFQSHTGTDVGLNNSVLFTISPGKLKLIKIYTLIFTDIFISNK